MQAVSVTSLAAVIDEVNEAAFFERTIAKDRRIELALAIADSQGKPGAYRGMFAPMEQDRHGIRLFMGDLVTSRAATAHILSEECMRALTLLDVDDGRVADAFSRSRGAAVGFLGDSPDDIVGEYCCGICSVSMLRAASSGAYGRRNERVTAAIAGIQAHRKEGRWGNYPFYYTLLALSEVESPEARRELDYARPACERAGRSRGSGVFGERRRVLLERVLG